MTFEQVILGFLTGCSFIMAVYAIVCALKLGRIEKKLLRIENQNACIQAQICVNNIKRTYTKEIQLPIKKPRTEAQKQAAIRMKERWAKAKEEGH